MRTLILCLLTLSSCTFPMGGGGECLVTPPATSAFVSAVPEGLSASVTAALTAGRVTEAAAASATTFDEKMVEIAGDPALSAEWARVVTPGTGDTRATARTARVASDLPIQANRLREAKVSQAEVRTVLEAASRGRMSASDMAELLAGAADAVEKNGLFDGFADFVVLRIDSGVRGEELSRVVSGEVEARGDKVSNKVELCHRPPGNPDKMKTLSVGPSALDKHLAHGDTEGPCEGDAAGEGGSNAKGNKGEGADKADKAAKGAGKGNGKGNGKGGGKGGGKGNGKGGE